jgi:tRNA(Ile)-lysidine synthase
LGEVAASDLEAVEDPGRVPVGLLRALSEPRQNNALRFALRAAGLPVPSAAQLAQLRHALTARGDAEVLVSWPGAEARLYRQHLYLQASAAPPTVEAGRLAVDAAMAVAGGELRLVTTQDYGIPDRWARDGLTVAFRVGGERFRPQRCRYQKSLKHWFQDQGIVPWMRNAVPLLYHDDQLIAVADICLADDLPQGAGDGPFWRPQWTGHARLR